MKRKLRCKTCGTTKNSANGQTLYLLGETATLSGMSGEGECWDCGEKRRDAAEEARQNNLTRLVEE